MHRCDFEPCLPAPSQPDGGYNVAGTSSQLDRFLNITEAVMTALTIIIAISVLLAELALSVAEFLRSKRQFSATIPSRARSISEI
jgi:hypothetical protein